MSKQVRVNVRSKVNNATIRRERRDGRDYIIVPSTTLPDNIVMNGSAGRVRYPADEIAKSFASLENTPAPLGHPTIEGSFVSAKEPEGLARGWVGAWNRNVRREGGRVHMDKVIDVATANQLDGGKAILSAIEKGDPIHTSVGLYCMLSEADDEDAEYEASEIAFDHDAILLGEEGAATPAQGVGMMVNSAKGADGEQIDVINSTIDDDLDRELTWAAESILRAVERKEQKPLLERLKSFMKQIVQGGPTPETIEGVALNASEDTMDKAQFDELSGKVAALSDALSGLDDKIATAVGNALKPVTDAMEAQAKAAAEKAEADRLVLANKVVEAGLLDEAVAKEATAPVLNALLEKGKQQAPAFRVNGAFKPSGEKPTYKLPEGD